MLFVATGLNPDAGCMSITTTKPGVSEEDCVIVATIGSSGAVVKTRRSTKRRRSTSAPLLTGEIRCLMCNRRFRPAQSVSGKQTHVYCGEVCAWKRLQERLS